MRTTLDPASLAGARAGLAALMLSGVLAAAPAALAQALVQPRPEIADFEKFLPPVAPVPWLDARSRGTQKGITHLPEAGSLSALLLAPQPANSWSGSSHAASAHVGFIRM